MNKFKSTLNHMNDEFNGSMGSSQKPTQSAAQQYSNVPVYGQGQGFVQHADYGSQGPETVFQGGSGLPEPHAGSYAPPQGYDAAYRYPSPNSPAFTPPNGYYPPPSTHHQQQYGHTSHQQFPTMSHPSGNPGSSSLNFPRRLTVWKKYVNSATHLGISANMDDDLWYAKWPYDGNLTIMEGNPKNKDGKKIAQTKYAGMMGNKAIITLSNGFTCELKKGTSLSLNAKAYYLTMDVEGAGQQTFVWKAKSGGLAGKLTEAGGGWNLYREGNTEAPLATYLQTGSGYSSRPELGQFEFVGEGATGSLGNNFTRAAVVTILKIIQREKDMKVVKAVLRGH